FGLVRGHIHIDRAVAFTAFAGEAEVQRLFDAVIAPAVLDNVTVKHFPEVVGAATGRVPFLARHHEAGAHGVVIRLAIHTAALPNAHAAQHRVREAASI